MSSPVASPTSPRSDAGPALALPEHIIVRQGRPLGRRSWSVADVSRLLGDDAVTCHDMSPARRRQYLTSRAWIREIVVGDFGDAWYGFQRRGPGTAPRLRHSALSVSISHTADRVAVAVASGVEVGIDIERTSDVFDIPSLQRRMCTPAELARATSLSGAQRRQWLTALWTVKEAYVKSRSRGLALDLRTVESARLPAARRSAWITAGPADEADLALAVVWTEGGGRP